MELIGHKDIFRDVARSGGTNEENLKKDLGQFTQRRHLITHCGDYNLNQSPPVENKIEKSVAGTPYIGHAF